MFKRSNSKLDTIPSPTNEVQAKIEQNDAESPTGKTRRRDSEQQSYSASRNSSISLIHTEVGPHGRIVTPSKLTIDETRITRDGRTKDANLTNFEPRFPSFQPARRHQSEQKSTPAWWEVPPKSRPSPGKSGSNKESAPGTSRSHSTLNAETDVNRLKSKPEQERGPVCTDKTSAEAYVCTPVTDKAERAEPQGREDQVLSCTSDIPSQSPYPQHNLHPQTHSKQPSPAYWLGREAMSSKAEKDILFQSMSASNVSE